MSYNQIQLGWVSYCLLGVTTYNRVKWWERQVRAAPLALVKKIERGRSVG